ncbi:hypothetical protein NP233_g4914 [Leucocoprinus birnbaumii]|uniref:DUF6593 domain-containing protein n=1 Tax=Leucocoprinus birnbaumii TaxID=56174 RepID=A0AAD5YRE9_9AGAR|nr:hypothetical protein NP233_g4914 [Leucocoprinus birnbaumii]
MYLTLTTQNPRDSDYLAEDGHVLYKVDKPNGFSAKTATIRKSVTGKSKGANEQYAFYAQVEFHDWSDTQFLLDNRSIPASEFLQKDSGWFSGGKRTFTASDGRQYTWKPYGKHLEMYRNDGTKTLMVKFTEYRPGLGPFMKKRLASLEIDSTCIPILDEVILTFIYCEKLRKDRNRAAANSAAASSAAASSAAAAAVSC